MYLENWMIPILCLILSTLAMSGFFLLYIKDKKTSFILSLVASGLIIVLFILGLIFGTFAPKEKPTDPLDDVLIEESGRQ